MTDLINENLDTESTAPTSASGDTDTAHTTTVETARDDFPTSDVAVGPEPSCREVSRTRRDIERGESIDDGCRKGCGLVNAEHHQEPRQDGFCDSDAARHRDKTAEEPGGDHRGRRIEQTQRDVKAPQDQPHADAEHDSRTDLAGQ